MAALVFRAAADNTNTIRKRHPKQDGQIAWSYDAPEELPVHYTIQDVALFSKGYLADYPVFIWNDEDGLLVLGYPKNSYTKFTTNYFSAKAVRKMPVFFIVMVLFDFALMFCAYLGFKRKILKSILLICI